METYLRRYFWVIQLVLVVAVAGLLAASVSNVISGLLGPLSVTAPPAVEVKKGGDQEERQRSLAGVQNDAFKPPPKAEAEEPAEEGPEEAPEEAPLALEGEYPPSSLPVALSGTLVAGDSSWSTAMLVDNGTKSSFSVKTGETFLENVKLVTVERERIIIENAGQLEQIEMGVDPGKDGAPTTGQRFNSSAKKPVPGLSTSLNAAPAIKPAVSGVAAGGGGGVDEYKKGITKTSDNSFTVDRSTLQKALDNPKALQDGARVLPNYSGGKIDGFRVSGLKPGSIFSELGVQSGDVIKSVNGKPLNGPNEALKLYQQLGSVGGVNITVERGGKPVDLSFQIK
jgi:general secretion pathway protein C